MTLHEPSTKSTSKETHKSVQTKKGRQNDIERNKIRDHIKINEKSTEKHTYTLTHPPTYLHPHIRT